MHVEISYSRETQRFHNDTTRLWPRNLRVVRQSSDGTDLRSWSKSQGYSGWGSCGRNSSSSRGSEANIRRYLKTYPQRLIRQTRPSK